MTETDFGYTNQRNYANMGLMDYNARFYSPTLGRFIQADTVIPDLTNSQAWNRYSYVYNNPVKYIDPSGHEFRCFDDDCEGMEAMVDQWMLDTNAEYDLNIVFGKGHRRPSLQNLLSFMGGIHEILKIASEEFLNKYLRIGVLRFEFQFEYREDGTYLTGYHRGGVIYTTGMLSDFQKTGIHEIFHWIDYQTGYSLSEDFMNQVGASWETDSNGEGHYNPGPYSYPSYGNGLQYENQREDFAESAEEFFFTVDYNHNPYPRHGEKGDRENVDLVPGSIRWQFIRDLVTTGEIPTNIP